MPFKYSLLADGGTHLLEAVDAENDQDVWVKIATFTPGIGCVSKAHWVVAHLNERPGYTRFDPDLKA